MIYLIYTFAVVIIGTILFVVYCLKFLVNNPHINTIKKFVYPQAQVNIVEQIWRAHDFRAQFRYIKEKDFMNEMRNFAYRPDTNPKTEILIDNGIHWEQMKMQYCRQIAKEMLDKGFVQIEKKQVNYGHEVDVFMNVKVYKPE